MMIPLRGRNILKGSKVVVTNMSAFVSFILHIDMVRNFVTS
jgi:hypothetical protein